MLAVEAEVAKEVGLDRVRVPVGHVSNIPGIDTPRRRCWEAYCWNVEVDRGRHWFYRKIIVVE